MIITTPGAADANSFADVAYFKAFRTNRLPAVASVLAASDPAIEIALIASCRMMGNNFDWTGSAVDSVQGLEWPRTGMLTRNNFAVPTTGAASIPDALKNAQCEYAYQMLVGVDFTADDAAARAGLEFLKAGPVSLKFQTVNSATSESVDMILRRLGSEFNYLSNAVPGEVRRILVPSWFNQPSILRPLFFGTFGGGRHGR